MKEEIEAILKHSQAYPFDLNVDNLLRQWKRAKTPFIKLFGNSNIWRSPTPIKINIPTEQRFRKFISSLDKQGLLTTDLENFLQENKTTFFENRASDGSKLLKNFKKFLSNNSDVRLVQDIASQYIQENKIEGYLYFSVDPRDFLTLSENNENWKSCQTLDGDFRAGNLSYMTDPTTVVVYLADITQKHLKCLPENMKWNSKKWRMLVHTDRLNCIYYNRQYPFFSETLLQETYTQFCKLLDINFEPPVYYGFRQVNSNTPKVLSYNQINLGGRIFNMHDVLDDEEYLGFSDLASSTLYTPIVSLNKAVKTDYLLNYGIVTRNTYLEELKKVKSIIGLKIGGSVYCPCCGKHYLEREDSFLCEDCIDTKDAEGNFYLACFDCHHRIYDTDEVFYADGLPYCKKCYKEILEEEGEDYGYKRCSSKRRTK